ncbi:MAG: hypothetical protein WAV47_14070 [Blastocatellia bacterium]
MEGVSFTAYMALLTEGGDIVDIGSINMALLTESGRPRSGRVAQGKSAQPWDITIV